MRGGADRVAEPSASRFSLGSAPRARLERASSAPRARIEGQRASTVSQVDAPEVSPAAMASTVVTASCSVETA